VIIYYLKLFVFHTQYIMIEQASPHIIFNFGCEAKISIAFSQQKHKTGKDLQKCEERLRLGDVLSQESKGMCVLCVFQVSL